MNRATPPTSLHANGNGRPTVSMALLQKGSEDLMRRLSRRFRHRLCSSCPMKSMKQSLCMLRAVISICLGAFQFRQFPPAVWAAIKALVAAARGGRREAGPCGGITGNGVQTINGRGEKAFGGSISSTKLSLGSRQTSRSHVSAAALQQCHYAEMGRLILKLKICLPKLKIDCFITLN